MKWKIRSSDEEGMTVTGPLGEITVFWEQKPALTEAGILAVLVNWNFKGAPEDFNVCVLAGEVAGVDRDTTIGSAVRDPELLKLFLFRRAKTRTSE